MTNIYGGCQSFTRGYGMVRQALQGSFEKMLQKKILRETLTISLEAVARTRYIAKRPFTTQHFNNMMQLSLHYNCIAV